MAYNKHKSEVAWKKQKEKEEEMLRQLHWDEDKIKELRRFDWDDFKRERKILERQAATDAAFFNALPTVDKKEYETLEDLIDEISNIDLILYLRSLDTKSSKILVLRMKGFRNKEIAYLLNINEKTVRRKIQKMRKDLENILEMSVFD